MTVGLDVLVHDVIAAMATDPELMLTVSPPTSMETAGYCRRSAVSAAVGAGFDAGGAPCSAASAVAKDVASDAGNDSADASWTRSPLTGFSPESGPPPWRPSG
jgi:hypothetical protein